METIIKEKKKISFAPAITFLCLEILALVAFSLGNSIILFSALGIVLAVSFLIIYFKQIKSDDLSSFAFFAFPIVVIGLLAAFSGFAKYEFDVPTRIFVPLAFISFSFAGYMVTYSNKFSVKTAMIVIYSAITIYTLINFFVTMTQFMPFYTLLYRSSYIYYDGTISSVPISDMAYGLIGFKLTEVTITYFSLFPSLLLTAVIALFFISPKKNLKDFIIFAAFTFVGFISLLFTPNKITLLTDLVVIIVIALVVLFGKNIIGGKITKIITICVCGLVLLGFILFTLNAQPELSSFSNFIKNNGFLNRIFNANYFADKFKPIVAGLFSKNASGSLQKLFGFPNNAEFYIYIDGKDMIANLSGSWLFDNIMTIGVFGWLFFIIGFGLGFYYLVKYMKGNSDTKLEKSLLFGFVGVYFIYSFIANDGLPLIFYKNSMPIITSGLFLICIFLVSYAVKKVIDEKKAIAKEAIKHEEQKA